MHVVAQIANTVSYEKKLCNCAILCILGGLTLKVSLCKVDGDLKSPIH